MAVTVPDVPFVESTSRAEQKLYILLKKLPDQFRVYHSVAYLVCPGAGPAREGEMDFLLLHPEPCLEGDFRVVP